MKKKLSLALSLLVFAAVSALAFSAFAAEGFTVKYNSVMASGTKQQLQVVIDSSAGASNESFTSSDTRVLTVSDSGVVTAVSAGTARVTYSPNGTDKSSVSITVKPMPSSLSLSASSKEINEGQSFNMNAKTDSSAYPCKIRYITSNSAVASVSASGKVTGRSSGTAVVTAITENGIRRSCTVTVYPSGGISLNKTAQRVSAQYDNVSRVVYGSSVRGRELEAFVIEGGGSNSKTLLCTFAVHGFEDNYAHDGKVLVQCANSLIEYIAQNPYILGNYRIVIVPCANPDGTIDGVNNLRTGSNAFGRCTAANVDMNRDFISGKFRAQESRALRQLMYDYDIDSYIDFHGWLDSVLGNGTFVDIFRSECGISRDQTGHYGASSGYIMGWVNDNLGARSALVEFKSPSTCNYRQVANGIRRVCSGSTSASGGGMVLEYSDSIPAPRGLKVNWISTESLELRWDSVSGTKGYQVQFSKDGVNWNSSEVFAQDSAILRGLDIGCTYKFRVRGFTYSGNVRTYSTHFSGWKTYSTKPDAVEGFTVSGRTADGSAVILNWRQKLNADGYNLYRYTNAGWQKIATLTGSMSGNYRVSVNPDSPYTFAIEAYKGDTVTVSERTQLNTYSAAPAPSGVSAAAVSQNTVRVQWNSNSGLGYYVQLAQDSSFTRGVITRYAAPGSSYCDIDTPADSSGYYARVRSCRSYGSEEICGGYSQAVSVNGGLFKPEGLTVYARGDHGTDLYLRWNGVEKADGYKVYIVSGGSRIFKGSTTDNYFVFTDLTAGWVYDVVVEAYNESAVSESELVSVCAAPQDMGAITVTATGDTLTASWQQTPYHGYLVQWSRDSEFATVEGSAYVNGGSTLSYSASVKNADEYYVRVRAFKNFEGERVFGAFCAPQHALVKPQAPSGYNVYARGDNGTDLYLEWNESTGAQGYRVYIVSGSGDILKGSTTENRFVFTDLTPSWNYTVMVVAFNGSMSSSSKTTVCAAPVAVTGVKASLTQEGVTLSWDAASCHGYLVQWSKTEDFSSGTASVYIDGSENAFYDIPLGGDAEDYYFRVRMWKWFEDERVFGEFSEPLTAVSTES